MFKNFIRKLAKNKKGNVLMITSMTAPVFIGFAGLSIDVGFGLYSKSQLRGAVETTALDIAENYTAPNNFSFYNAKERDRSALTKNGIALSKSGLPSGHADAAIKREDVEIGEWDIENKVFTPAGSSPIVNAARVKGELSTSRKNRVSTFFGEMFGFSPDLNAEALAMAPLIPGFHFLNPSAAGTLRHSDGSFGDTTDMDIGDIWINSNARNAFIASPKEHTRGFVGAYIKGGATEQDDKINKNLFRLPDLLAKQTEPARPLFHCDFNGREIDQTDTVILSPGVYCGGLTVRNSQLIYFFPGTYQFLDGPLEIDSSPLVYGNEVFFHFDGAGAALNFTNSSVYLAGRTSGDYKGFLIFSSRSTTNGIAHQFRSTRGEFVGTIYAPDNHISVQRSTLNGKCHSLCLVSDTMSVTQNSFLNWYQNSNQFKYFKHVPRVAPTALEPYLSPYLVSPS